MTQDSRLVNWVDAEAFKAKAARESETENDSELSRDFYAWVTTDSDNELRAVALLGDSDAMECRDFAAAYCDSIGLELAKASGLVTDGCGDFTVTIGRAWQFGGVCCWVNESFFYGEESA